MVNPIVAGIIIGIVCTLGGYFMGFVSCATLVKMVDKMVEDK